MDDDRLRPRPSAWWIAAGVAAALALAWAAGAIGGGTDVAGGSTGEGANGPGSPERLRAAEGFWESVGSGEEAAALGALVPDAPSPLTHYVAFAAAFEAGFRPEGCREAAAGTVRCTLRATDPRLIDLYWARSGTTEYVTSASITFSDGDIAAFQMPDLITSAADRLFAHAGATGDVPAACDRVNYDAIGLPPFNTRMAQTAACATALLQHLEGAIDAREP